jgi:hypothetical protein
MESGSVSRASVKLGCHLSRTEVEQVARVTGSTRRTHRAISAFDFAISCAMAALAEGKRGFASVWRMLAAAPDRIRLAALMRIHYPALQHVAAHATQYGGSKSKWHLKKR